MTIKWEYFTTPLLIRNTKAVLGNFGEDGWELITVLPGLTGKDCVSYFKRPKAD